MMDPSKDDDSVGKVTSPTDLTFASPFSSRKSIAAPIVSNLPHLFNHLRTNESTNTPSEEATPRRSLSGSLHDDDLSTSPRRGDAHATSPHPLPDRKNSLSPSLESLSFESDVHDFTLDHLFLRGKNFKIPSIFLHEGLPLLKVSHKSKKRILLRFDPVEFVFTWRNVLTALLSSGKAMLPIAPTASKTKVYEFSIDDIKSITCQRDAGNYREELHISKEFEHKWMTLIFYDRRKKKLKSLHLIADTDHDFKRLYHVIQGSKMLREDLVNNFLLDVHDISEVRRTILSQGNEKHAKEYLTFNEILKYSRRLNINVNEAFLRKVFDDILHQSDRLSLAEFKEFVSRLKRRDDISSLMTRISGKSVLELNDFIRFHRDVQGEVASEDHLSRLFRKFCVSSNDHWTQENLNNYLLSKYNSPHRNDAATEAYFDYPLSEYFISSSHNTYLLGRQVAGDSSVEGYIKALQRGCRCVEIDVWDGSNEVTNVSEPIVSHGRTFTSEISFRNVIETIKKYAFIITPYPLIISLDVNCSASNQLKVVQILKEVLGSTLITAPIDETNHLPSPSMLKGKILVKSKKTSPFTSLVYDTSGDYISTTTTTTSFSEDNSSASSTLSFRIHKQKGTKIVDDLSDLGVYLQGIKFRNFSLPESKTYNHCFSLSEKSINSMLKDDVKRASLNKHNRRYLMRVYPSKTRLRSTNFIPIKYWSEGAQMVATNWQTYDLGQQINEAMFEAGHNRGYVLKPLSLRKPVLKSEKAIAMVHKKIRFSFLIISGHQLPKAQDSDLAINPFVTFEILGAADIIWDPHSHMQRTPIVGENGFNPTWNADFSGIIVAEHEFVFIKLVAATSISTKEEDEVSIIGFSILRLSDLNKGYRYIPINDLSGEELVYSSLFVRVDYAYIDI